MPLTRRIARGLAPRAALLAGSLLLGGPRPAAAQTDEQAVLRELIDNGDAAYAEQEYADAAERYEAALVLARYLEQPAAVEEILPDLIASHFANGNDRKAYEHQKDLLEATLEKNQARLSADAALKTAVIAVRARYFRDADKQLSFAEVLFTETGGPKDLAKVAFYRALSAQGQRRYQDTIKQYETARRLHLDAGDAVEAAARRLDVANVEKEFLSRFEDALKSYDEAIEELRAAGAEDRVLAAQIDKGNLLVDIGRIQEATTLLLATQAKLASGAPRSWIRATQMLAKARYRSGSFVSALKLIDEITAVVPAVGDKAARAGLEIDAINLRAMAAAELGRFERAYADFDAAIARARATGLRAKEAFLHNNVGYWLREQGRPREALVEHQRALQLDDELRSPEGRAYDLRNLGLTFTALGDLERATASLTEALALSVEVGAGYNTAYSHLGLGEVQLRQKRWPAAVASFHKAIEVAEAGQLRAFAWQAHAGLARAAFQQGDQTLSLQHFRRAIELIEAIEDELVVDDARRDLKASERVRSVYADYESLLRRQGRQKEADAVRRRAAPRPVGRATTI
jgi:tetratricopeptide (TPR) repeat protein